MGYIEIDYSGKTHDYSGISGYLVDSIIEGEFSGSNSKVFSRLQNVQKTLEYCQGVTDEIQSAQENSDKIIKEWSSDGED